MRALCKEPAKRYQSAAEFAGDLRKAIAKPQGGFVKYPKSPEQLEQERQERRRRRERDQRRLRIAVTVTVAATVLLALAAGLWYLVQLRNSYVMPSLVGQEQMLAQDAMEQLNALVEISYSYSEDYEEGIVISQSRAAGERAAFTEPVMLTVSRGTQYYYLQNYIGQGAEDTAQALRAEGVESVSVEYVQSDSAPGMVISMNQREGMRSKSDPVVITASGQSVLMPSLIGLSRESAEAILAAEGLLVGTVTEGSAEDAPVGTVLSQSVGANAQVLSGTAVDLTVNQAHAVNHYPDSKLSVVVPLNGSAVALSVTTPSGTSQEISLGTLNAGTYRIALSSPEAGVHTVRVVIDGVTMETQEIGFE